MHVNSLDRLASFRAKLTEVDYAATHDFSSHKVINNEDCVYLIRPSEATEGKLATHTYQRSWTCTHILC